MKYSQLGDTDLQVSRICLGTMTFGEQNSESEAHEQLSFAIDQGINFIDTAELYAIPSNEKNNGLTETFIGTWLKHRADRDKIVVATKIAGPSGGLKYIRNPLNYTSEQIHTAIDGSLQRLQTDYVDLYQLHWPERKTNFFGKRGFKYAENDPWKDNLWEVIETLSGLIKAGKIRHFGISNETPWGFMRFLQIAEQAGLPRCVSVQNPYSLLNRLYEVGMAEISIRENVGLLAYSPMAFGLLSGKYHQTSKPDDGRLSLFKQMSRYNGKQAFDATAEYLGVAQKYGISLAQMSLAFVNSRPFLTSNIIGATTMAQLKENIASIYVELSEECLKEIEAIHYRIPNPTP
ncbi:MAG: NADP(H)-dependent aldo-keto reductase [Bacteroidota bacterium]